MTQWTACTFGTNEYNISGDPGLSRLLRDRNSVFTQKDKMTSLKMSPIILQSLAVLSELDSATSF